MLGLEEEEDWKNADWEREGFVRRGALNMVPVVPETQNDDQAATTVLLAKGWSDVGCHSRTDLQLSSRRENKAQDNLNSTAEQTHLTTPNQARIGPATRPQTSSPFCSDFDIPHILNTL